MIPQILVSQTRRLGRLEELLIIHLKTQTFIYICRAETNIRNVTNEPFSKRTNIRIFVRFDD